MYVIAETYAAKFCEVKKVKSLLVMDTFFNTFEFIEEISAIATEDPVVTLPLAS